MALTFKEIRRLFQVPHRGRVRLRDYDSDYQDAFENMLQHTSTRWAPWWVVPADHKWVTRTPVAGIITRSIDGLGVKFPEVSAEQLRRLEAARRQLLKDR